MDLNLEDVKKVPKTRAGGTFTDPDTIKLHGNDFSLEEKMNELSEDERKLVESYIMKCEEELLKLNLENIFFNGVTYDNEKSSWDSHYSLNKRHFPLKNYIILAFPLLKTLITLQSEEKYNYIVECGCGTGSTLLPLMKQFKKNVYFVGFDVSDVAVSTFLDHDIAKEFTDRNLLTAFSYDISGVRERLPDGPEKVRSRKENNNLKNVILGRVPSLNDGANAILLVFVLSSLPTLESMLYALKELASILKIGGCLFFRDYAIPDHNFFRFINQHNNKFNDLSFCKGDGTLQMFFEINFVRKLFLLAGFEEVNNHGLQYHCNRIINRKNGKKMDKIFINGTFKLSPNYGQN